MNLDVSLEIFYPHTPDRVWQALTDRRALTTWMMDNDFEPQLGHKFQFRQATLPGFDILIHCEVIELEPLKRLAYRWQDPQTRKSTIVQWKLTAVAGGTTLQLHHNANAYESPMNTLMLSELNDKLPTLQGQKSFTDSFTGSFTSSFTKPFTSLTIEPSLIQQIQQAEWNDRLLKLSQSLNSEPIAI